MNNFFFFFLDQSAFYQFAQFYFKTEKLYVIFLGTVFQFPSDRGVRLMSEQKSPKYLTGESFISFCLVYPVTAAYSSGSSASLDVSPGMLGGGTKIPPVSYFNISQHLLENELHGGEINHGGTGRDVPF